MTDDKEDGEKLFSEKVAVDPNTTEVAKFIPEKEKKVTPINIEGAKTKFTGLTKEELMKYAKDPFWIRLRWILFVLFWLVWFLMLFAAVFVIVITPKCKEPPPPEWWQQSALYLIDVRSLPVESYEGSKSVIGGLRYHLEILKDMGIHSVLLRNAISSSMDVPGETLNYTDVNSVLVNTSVFQKDVIEYAESKGVSILLELNPNHSGKNAPSFIRSALKEDKFFQDLYVWYPTVYVSEPTTPPNNWRNVYNQSAWGWDDKRKQFYLHQFNASQPDFNFRNPSTVQFFSDVFKFWLNLGVKGIHLDKCEYLVEDEQFRNETPSRNTSFTQGQYGFYSHFRTFELPETASVIANWSVEIRNHSGVLSVSGGIRERKSLANFVLRPVYFSPNFTAKEFKDKIEQWRMDVDNPAWEWRCTSDVTLCFPDEAIDGLAFVTFLLPGTPIVSMGMEFGYAKVFNDNGMLNRTSYRQVLKNQSDDPDSHWSIIKKLIKLRGSPGCLYGSLNMTVVGTSVFAFTRVKPGHPGYLIAWNIARVPTTVNFRQLATIPDDLLVVIKSGRIFNGSYPLKQMVTSTEVRLPPFGGIVFSYVPRLK